MYQKTVLPNGLRIVSSSMPHVRSVAIQFFIGVGSRFEGPAQAGIFHFLEHLLFKGSQKRSTAQDISRAIEGIGGTLNGATDRELTVYWCKVAHPHFGLGLDLLVDMLRHPLLAPEEVEKERQVILEELNMAWDSPRFRVGQLLDGIMWPGQPLGRDVAGTKETVSAITHPMLLGHHARHYRPNNTVVSVAGALAHDQVVEAVAKALGDWPPGELLALEPMPDQQKAPRFGVEARPTEQVYLNLGIHGLSYLHPDRYALDLLNVVLGEGMSSRLFEEIRERRGLAYDVYSYVSHFRDGGVATVFAGVAPRNIEAALVAILGEIRRLWDGIPASELRRAQEFSKGHLLLALEDTRAVASFLGAQELLTDQILTVDDIVSLVDGIAPEDLSRVAQSLFTTEKLNLAVVGPLGNHASLEAILRL